MKPYLDIKKALLLKSREEIIEQINIRNDHIANMVGWLYPSILKSDIEKLYKRLKEIDDPVGDFQI